MWIAFGSFTQCFLLAFVSLNLSMDAFRHIAHHPSPDNQPTQIIKLKVFAANFHIRTNCIYHVENTFVLINTRIFVSSSVAPPQMCSSYQCESISECQSDRFETNFKHSLGHRRHFAPLPPHDAVSNSMWARPSVANEASILWSTEHNAYTTHQTKPFFLSARSNTRRVSVSLIS